MVYKKRRSTRKPKRLARRALGYRRRRYAPRNRRVNDYAGCSETVTMIAQIPGNPTTTTFQTVPNTPGQQCFNMETNSLINFTRASTIARGYQFYRIKYFEVTFLPSADTFTGAVGTSTKPYLYYMIDKGDALPDSLTNDQIKSLGAKPIALDEKPIHVRWSPGVSLSTEISTVTGATSANKYMISPWLNVDANPNSVPYDISTVVHNGMKFVAESSVPVSYIAKVTAHFQFKKPSLVTAEPAA